LEVASALPYGRAPLVNPFKKTTWQSQMILESFDGKTLTKMEIALERACGVILTGNQKHRSRRYIAKRIISCASGGNRNLDSLTAAAIAAAEELNASRSNRSRSATIGAGYPADRLSRHEADRSLLLNGEAGRDARVPCALASHKASALGN
jgi:hypothetical protein